MRAALFDLDGTLLDIDIDAFLRTYFGALGPVLAAVTGLSAEASIQAVMDATRQMMRPHPGLTNREAFDLRFSDITGVDLSRDDGVIQEFYDNVFPTLGAGIQPRAGARRAIEAAQEAGMLVVVATNPIFPAAAVRERLRWAGLSDVAFALVTTYEAMHACKPDPAYFTEIAQLIEIEPEECLMIGDDPGLDMGAALVGMKTFMVGDSACDQADYVGDLDDLASLLSSIA